MKCHPLTAFSDSIKLQLDHSQTFTLQTLTSRPFLSLLVLFGLSLSGSYAAASPQCDIKTIYKPLEDKTKALEKQTRATLGSRPGMRIDNVLWVGKGQYQLICNGRYPSLKPISRSNGPAIDHRTIKNWTRGDGKASGPGRYVFQDKSSYKKIPILPMNHERIAEFGVKVASDKDILNTPESSVLATYDYGINYFKEFVLPENGPRLERHPNDHLVTLVKSFKGRKSFFVVGHINHQALELAAIELKPGVTILVKGNTVHTNDYVTGVVQEMYPEVWGIDEVRLVNLLGNKVTLRPTQ